ncbi:MAG: hypothetical protein Q9162_006890 [Coniocarpon cinnabarinum]
MPPKRKRDASSVEVQPQVIVPEEEQYAASATPNGERRSKHSPPGAPASTASRSRSNSVTKSTQRAARSVSDRANGDDPPVHKAELVKVSGDAEDLQMEEPPKAGLVDPAGGFKTNAPPDRVIRVYADGVFDLFHLGHMRQLEQAKNAFPGVHLTVGVTGDDETLRRKGLTVLSARERAESLRHCRWVDAVLEDCPWVVTEEFLEQHEFDYVAHDDLPYGAAEGDDIYLPIKSAGKFLVTQRTEGVSTTGIITKIVKDYNNYVGRQLKRGTSRKELNVSWLKKNELDFKRHMGELREAVRSNWTSTGQELGKELNRLLWSDKSRPASPAPHASRASVKDGAVPNLLTLQTHASRLEAPRSPGSISPGGTARGANSTDFVTGYTLGLVGGIRSWMTGTGHGGGERSNGVSPPSSGSDEDNEGASEARDSDRGRQGKRVKVT